MPQTFNRTPAREKAKQLAKYLRKERPDYEYLRQVARYLRQELDIEVITRPKKLPKVPTEAELRKFYQVVWKTRKSQDLIIIKTFLYTGIRVSELVNLLIEDIDLDECHLRINKGKGGKDRVVPFPVGFQEILALHLEKVKNNGAKYLFESSWQRPYTDRGIRKMMRRYADQADLERAITPHQLRHFLLTWLKKQGVDDALIQPYSGHASRKSLEVYSLLALSDAQEKYNEVMEHFPL